MAVAALVFFLAPWMGAAIGPDRARILLLLLIALFAVYALKHSIRLLGLITRDKTSDRPSNCDRASHAPPE